MLEKTFPSPPPPSSRSKIGWWIFGAIALSLVGVAGGTVYWGQQKLEAIDRSLQGLDPDAVSTFARRGTMTILAADGSILQQTGPITHDELQIEDAPKRLIQAILAAEDRRFYEHDGIDYKAIARAARANLRARNWVEGGSTITQQLTRMVFLTQEITLDRKLREARLAQRIEERFTKAEILEKYLNLVYLGAGAYGVADAAWVYFAKSVNELTLSEIALIAGLPAAPSDFSPLNSPQLARQRRDEVLADMAEAGYISAAQARSATREPLVLDPRLPKRLQLRMPYFTTFVRQELPKYLTDEQIEKGGLIVETTLDPQWQELAQTVVRDAVATKGAREGFGEAALAAIDPRNGEIKALIGGTDFEVSQFNRASQALRQPGSTFKGIIYTAAIAAGFSPYDVYKDTPFVIDGYQPKNFGGGYSGAMPLHDALAQSVNVIAVKLLADVGFEPTLKVAKAMGIESKLGEVYPLALGAFEVTLLEMTNAYGTLANKGKHYPATGIRRIVNTEGEVLYDAKTQAKPNQAVDPDSAAIVTWMLQQVVSSGTGRPAKLSDRPVAGKTGTSDAARDLWFIGYIPQLAVGVWLGNDNNAPTFGSSSTAAAVWHEFVSQIASQFPVEAFPELPNLQTRAIELEAKPDERNGDRDASQTSSDEGGWLNPGTPGEAGDSVRVKTPDPSLEYGTPEYFERHYDLSKPEFNEPTKPEPFRNTPPTPTIPPEKLISPSESEPPPEAIDGEAIAPQRDPDR
ncbi:Multimodular transpeptidase-transglycosylase [Geitlerinema sp. FC II]|nr:Multimodular transpeptidase-transglycosylase [Geitlerinema sp. FC II]